MISDKDTNIIYFSERIKIDPRFKESAQQITGILDKFDIEYRFLPKTKDIWARDYMPIQVSENEFIEYRYDPDYLQGIRKKRRNLKTYPDMVCDAIGLKTVKSDIIMDGGNFIKSGDCIIMTEKIVSENRLSYSKPELIECLRKTFIVDKVILIPWYRDDIYGHADGMLRFIDDETVLLNPGYEEDSKFLYRIRQAGLKYRFMHYSTKNRDHRRWAYLNFLQTRDIILLPKFNIEEDSQALNQIKQYFPDYAEKGAIVQVDMTEIIKDGGALNCMSWTIKD